MSLSSGLWWILTSPPCVLAVMATLPDLRILVTLPSGLPMTFNPASILLLDPILPYSLLVVLTSLPSTGSL